MTVSVFLPTCGTSAPPSAVPRVLSPDVIEREIPAPESSADQLHSMSRKSCAVLQNLAVQIQWRQSFVTDEKIYCIYLAPNEALVREHARQGGFTADRISEVRSVIDPMTAEPAAR